jgi:5-formyltetrahydrofolate cyclo-ligase
MNITLSPNFIVKFIYDIIFIAMSRKISINYAKEMTALIKEQKKLIRKSILEKRNSLSAQEIKQSEILIMNNLMKLNQFILSQNIFCYLSFRSEVPTKGLIEYCQQQGKKVYIPVCVNETKEMIISRYDSDIELAASNYGVLEPTSETIKIADRNILDTAIMPGAVFDRRGYRIGYGAGYYDKFFAHTNKQIFKIALAFSFQIVEDVPKDDFDIPVDCIVTDKGIVICSR